MKEDQEIRSNFQIFGLPALSKTEKHTLTVMAPEFNLKVLQGCMLWQLLLSLPPCTQHLFTCTCLHCLLLHSASSSRLSAFIFSPHQTQQPQPFIPLFSVTFWVSLSPCAAILSPKTLHHQSPGLRLLLFPNISTLSLSIPPTFHSPKTQNTTQILSLPLCTDIETGIRTAHFSIYAGCLHMALFAHSSLSTLWGWYHLFTPS